LLDDYLAFVGARARVNTWLATAYDLKVFFTVVGKEPAQVTAPDAVPRNLFACTCISVAPCRLWFLRAKPPSLLGTFMAAKLRSRGWNKSWQMLRSRTSTS
jgi:hypothetical protein